MNKNVQYKFILLADEKPPKDCSKLICVGGHRKSDDFGSCYCELAFSII